MKNKIWMIALASFATSAWAYSETKTFVATDESRVQACAKAKEQAQTWVGQNLHIPQYYPKAWKPEKAEYSNCDCGQSESQGKTDCSIDATLSN